MENSNPPYRGTEDLRNKSNTYVPDVTGGRGVTAGSLAPFPAPTTALPPQPEYQWKHYTGTERPPTESDWRAREVVALERIARALEQLALPPKPEIKMYDPANGPAA